MCLTFNKLRDFAGVLLLCSTVVCSSVSAEPLSEHSTELVFAVGERAPFITERQPGYGLYAERVKTVFEKLGYRVRFDFMPWRRAYEQTRSGEYAATFAWIWNELRGREVLYPRYPIAQAWQKGFYKKSNFPEGMPVYHILDAEAVGMRIVGVSGYWYEETLQRSGIRAEMVATPDSAWRFLHSGRADIYFEEESVGWSDLERVLGADMLDQYATTNAVQREDMFILFSRHHPMGEELRDQFDSFFDTAVGQGMCQAWTVCS